MPSHDANDRASDGDRSTTRPQRQTNSNSDEPVVHHHQLVNDNSPAPNGNQFSQAIASIQHVAQEVHEMLSTVSASAGNNVNPPVARQAEEIVADGGGSEEADMLSDEWESISSHSISEDSFEIESDPFEDDIDPFESWFDPFLEDPYIDDDDDDDDDVVDDDDMDSELYNQGSDVLMDDDRFSSDEDSGLPADPYDRELLGSLTEPELSLHAAVVRGDSKALAQWKAWNPGVWARKVEGDTELHCAARSGDVATVEHLIKNGANFRVTNEKRHTPLEVAALCGHAAVVKALLRRGAADDWEVIEHALLAAKSTAVIRVLAEDEKDPISGVTGAELLTRAARDGRVAVLRALLKAGADPNHAWFNGTALHVAARRGHIRCVQVLLENGADLSTLDDSRWTALHHAAAGGYPEMVRFLVDTGLDPTAMTCEGDTAMDLAADDDVRMALRRK